MASWLEQRRARRRRRQRGEEILAWIIVPIIALCAWWVGAQVYDFVREPIQTLLKASSQRTP